MDFKGLKTYEFFWSLGYVTLISSVLTLLITQVIKVILKKKKIIFDETLITGLLGGGSLTLDLIAEDIVKIKVNNTYLTETSTYTYDINVNITSIDTDDNTTRYTYDSLNRLVREDNAIYNKTITYKYDKAGNILLKKEYGYTLENNLTTPTIKEYIYDCSKRDRLISYDGNTIIYDDMGRPVLYKGKTLVWSTNNTLARYGEYEYRHDSNGIRRSKKVNGEETSYTTYGNQILQEKRGAHEITYLYTLNKLIGFVYNNVYC